MVTKINYILLLVEDYFVIKNRKTPSKLFFIFLQIVAFCIPFILLGFSSDAKYESLSNLISDISLVYSKTKSATLKIHSTDKELNVSDSIQIVNDCRNRNLYKTAQELYGFRASYSANDLNIVYVKE